MRCFCLRVIIAQVLLLVELPIAFASQTPHRPPSIAVNSYLSQSPPGSIDHTIISDHYCPPSLATPLSRSSDGRTVIDNVDDSHRPDSATSRHHQTSEFISDHQRPRIRSTHHSPSLAITAHRGTRSAPSPALSDMTAMMTSEYYPYYTPMPAPLPLPPLTIPISATEYSSPFTYPYPPAPPSPYNGCSPQSAHSASSSHSPPFSYSPQPPRSSHSAHSASSALNPVTPPHHLVYSPPSPYADVPFPHCHSPEKYQKYAIQLHYASLNELESCIEAQDIGRSLDCLDK